jgi:hypothetical protein
MKILPRYVCVAAALVLALLLIVVIHSMIVYAITIMDVNYTNAQKRSANTSINASNVQQQLIKKQNTTATSPAGQGQLQKTIGFRVIITVKYPINITSNHSKAVVCAITFDDVDKCSELNLQTIDRQNVTIKSSFMRMFDFTSEQVPVGSKVTGCVTIILGDNKTLNKCGSVINSISKKPEKISIEF